MNAAFLDIIVDGSLTATRNSPGIWLDLFPPDLSRYLAAVLISSTSSFDFLLLADDFQFFSAVKTVVQAVPCDSPLQRSIPPDFGVVLGGEYLDETTVQNLLRKSTWTRASIDINNQDVSVQLNAYDSLKSLKLRCQRVDRSLRILSDVAWSPHIHDLRIRCGCWGRRGRRECYLRSAIRLPIEDQAVPGVEKLTLECAQMQRDGYKIILKTFDRLRELTLHGLHTLSDETAALLKYLDALHLYDLSTKDVINVLKVAPVVRTVAFKVFHVFSSDSLNEAELLCLSSCANLLSLKACITPGAERLLELLPNSIKELSLVWLRKRPNPQQGSEEHLHVLNSRAVIDFVQCNGGLSVLRLRNVMVPEADLMQMLTSMGRQLEELEICLWWDSSRALKVSSVMNHMAVWNTNIRKLELQRERRPRIGRRDMSLTENQARRLVSSFCLLRKRAPRLNTVAMESVLCDVLGFRWYHLYRDAIK